MRDIVLLLASLAGAAVLTALAILYQPESFWRFVFWAGIAVFLACTVVLIGDYLRPDGKRFYLLGIGAGIALLTFFCIAFNFDSSKTSDLDAGLINLSNEQLRQKASRFTAQLREFEAEYKMAEKKESIKDFAALSQVPHDDKRKAIADRMSAQSATAQNARSAQHTSQFMVRFKGEAAAFRSTLFARQGIFPPYPYDGRAAAISPGMLTGINPIAELADYLDEIIQKLPK